MNVVFSRWLKDARDDARRLLQLTENPDVISFAGGLPAPEVFPHQEVAAAFAEVLGSQSLRALQYGPAEGITELRELVAVRLMQSGMTDAHIVKVRELYKSRRDVMLSALHEHMPPGYTWNRPEGGMFIWVKTPSGVKSENLFKAALASKAGIVPGAAFYPENPPTDTFRLNFSNASADRIFTGIGRLAQAVSSLSWPSPIR